MKKECNIQLLLYVLCCTFAPVPAWHDAQVSAKSDSIVPAGLLTAGNSVCKEPCSRRGYSYSWCYTSNSPSKWEYCCESDCDPSTHTCNSGSKTPYCGSYDFDAGEGLHTANGEACIGNFPCGKHGKYNHGYWCYTDSKGSWDWCCVPGQPCTNGGCYTGDDDTFWQFCKQPATPCGCNQ